MISIAVIGGGPSGLFFCHAVERLRRSHPNMAVQISCFERSSEPGGVWRGAANESTDMYSQLWSNGSSHCLEFYDYTFDQHFRGPVPVYLKRQDLLEYMLGRVQHKCPDFFEKFISFRSSVDHVAFDDTTQKFAVTVRNLDTDDVETQSFDKCIWACGENGRRKIPKSLVETFEDFKGPVLHSSEVADTERFTTVVRNKKVLLVGGGYSAEDIALQAIQTGAEHIYISSRSFYSSEVSMTKLWPGNKVTMVPDQVPFLVTGNGRTIQFHDVWWNFDHYERETPGVSTKLRDIDTVIICTGYMKNLDMLEPKLRADGFPSYEYSFDDELVVPDNWEMPPNLMGELVGDVPVPKSVKYPTEYLHPRFYHGVLMSNPNMMFVSQYGSDIPLLAIEAHCALLAGFATEAVPLPSIEQMRKENDEEALLMMQSPYHRYNMDRDYADAVNNIWPDTDCFPAYDKASDENWPDQIRKVSHIMAKAKYPVSFGTRHELNDLGQQLFQMGWSDYLNRFELHRENDDEVMWRTFRDVSETCMFRSIYTGTAAIPLDKPWMRIQAEALQKETGRTSPRSVDDPPPLMS